MNNLNIARYFLKKCDTLFLNLMYGNFFLVAVLMVEMLWLGSIGNFKVGLNAIMHKRQKISGTEK